VVRIPVAREVDPSVTDRGCEFTGFGGTPGRERREVGVIEHVGDFTEVVGAGPPIQNRRVIAEQI
jgi:hypothetical protein